MNFSNKNQTNRIYGSSFINKKLLSTFALPLFLLISAVVIIGSGCEDSHLLDYKYQARFLTPENETIFYTSNVNEKGENLGPEIVHINIEFTTENVPDPSPVSVLEIKNSASEVVFSKNVNFPYDEVFVLCETFQTTIKDTYSATITIYNDQTDNDIIESRTFIYQDQSSSGPTDN